MTTPIPPGYADPDGVEGPISIRQPVAWGELDALGHVNHTIFLRWFENARLTWFERVGIGALLREADTTVGPILARVEVDYRAPVGYPDVIWADLRCVEIGRSSLTLATRVWSEKQQAIVAEGKVVAVMLDYATGRTAPIFPAVRAAIVAFDAPIERGSGG